MRFPFTLTPLDLVAPWGGATPRLHWFGLTDGTYQIEIGGQLLPPEGPGIDYYVARLWEDLVDLLPEALEHVPDDLVPFVSRVPGRWDLSNEATDAAAAWHANHTLYFSYLVDGPHIWAWRSTVDDVDTMTLAWNWAADQLGGQVSARTEEFVAAVHQLDHDLMEQMAYRIETLRRDGVPDGVEIDLDALVAEHQLRTTRLSERLLREPVTDWDAVRAGAHLLIGA